MPTSSQASAPSSAIISVGIVGASGYSGEELVRLLARHPHARLEWVTSRTLAGQKLVDVMPQYAGLIDQETAFSPSDPKALAQSDLDLVFLALPHGVASEYARPLVAAGKRVIDLSADYRLQSAATYATFYGQPHPDVQLLEKSAYVIPEIHTSGWQSCPLIACPGCYPTSILTPLYPLLNQGIIAKEHIVINSCSGVSGAGKKVAQTFLYCERNESAMAYGMPQHRHLSEIEEQLSTAAGEPIIVQFNPHLSPMKRGIATTITVAAQEKSIDRLYQVWQHAYGDRRFVHILPSGQFPDTADTVGTNRIDMSAVYDARTENFVITSAEDNLLKGASGQAVQIMNLWFGFDEAAGLF